MIGLNGHGSCPSFFKIKLRCGFQYWEHHRRCLVLIYYGDDSGSARKSVEKHCILAGYLAECSDWDAFSTDWRAVLDDTPAIRYFKMGDAFHLKGQFLGWSDSAAHQKVMQLIEVIRKHSERIKEFSSFISWEQYSRISNKDFVTHPYYFCFHGVVAAIHGHLTALGQDERVALVLDHQSDLELPLARQLELLRQINPELGKRIGNVSYESDETVVALQAADLIAWHVRRYHGDHYVESQYKELSIRGVERVCSPWRTDNVMRLDQHITELRSSRALHSQETQEDEE